MPLSHICYVKTKARVFLSRELVVEPSSRLTTVRPESLVHVPLPSHVFVINPSGITTGNTYRIRNINFASRVFVSSRLHPSRAWAVIRFGQVWSKQNTFDAPNNKSRPCKVAELLTSYFAPYNSTHRTQILNG